MNFLIAGLVAETVRHANDNALEGPVLAASLGAIVNGAHACITCAIPKVLSQSDALMISSFDRGLNGVASLDETPLRWDPAAPANVALLTGDPTKWTVPARDFGPDIDGIVLANADPKWHVELLQLNSKNFVVFDLNAAWLHREMYINECVRKSHLITVSGADFKCLPASIWTGARKGVPLFVKRGNEGVTLLLDSSEVALLPPNVREVRNETGAGDFLLGALAACAYTLKPSTLSDWEQVYYAAVNHLSDFLFSPTLFSFWQDVRSQIRV